MDHIIADEHFGGGGSEGIRPVHLHALLHQSLRATREERMCVDAKELEEDIGSDITHTVQMRTCQSKIPSSEQCLKTLRLEYREWAEDASLSEKAICVIMIPEEARDDCFNTSVFDALDTLQIRLFGVVAVKG